MDPIETMVPPHQQSANNNIFQRIHKVMNDVKYIQKEERKVNNQYKFVSHDAVIEKIRPALIEHGIAVTVSVEQHAQDGNRCCVDLAVDFVNIDNPSDRIRTNGFGYGVDNQDKGPGKAISYAFKYILLKTFCLETGDDPERDDINYQANGKNQNGNNTPSKPNGNGKSQPANNPSTNNDLIKNAKKQCAVLIGAVNKKLGEAGLPQFDEKNGEFEAFAINAWCSISSNGELSESIIEKASKNPRGAIDWFVGIVEKKEQEKAQREQGQPQQQGMF